MKEHIFTELGLKIFENGTVTNLKSGNILTHCPDKKGYLRIYVSVNSRRKGFSVHRLLAMAFIPNPEHKPEVNHKDGVKSNNSLSNLEWVTKSENIIHAYKTGLQKFIQPEEMRIRDMIICDLYANAGLTHHQLGTIFNMATPNVTRIINAKAS